MITELNKLKDEILDLKEPSTITEFQDHTKLIVLAERVDVTLRNIYDSEHVLNLDKNAVIRFFEPTNSMYIKDGIRPYQKHWKKGKEAILNHIDSCIKDIELKQKFTIKDTYIDTQLIFQLSSFSGGQFDTKKLVQYLNEVNSTFQEGNYLACILLLRAILNYIPPIFGQSTFAQVTSQVGRSLKDIFTFLEEGLRKIADLHTHRPISSSESLPSHRLIDVYKPQFETLIQEIIARL